MKVLVAHASRHGATAGIAQRIGATLARAGLDVDVKPIADARDIARASHLGGYDGFVIGSAIYAFHWLGEARDFVRHNADVLRSRPVWIFGSGPLGDKPIDDKGNDVTIPPKDVAGVADMVHAQDMRVFFGAYDPADQPVGFMEHVMRAIPAARTALPAGDFRQWPEIERWASSIAADLRSAVATA